MYVYLVVLVKYSNILTNVVLPSIVLTLCDMKMYEEKNLPNTGQCKCIHINVGGSLLICS